MSDKSSRINLILFGPPGSGKGTQAKILEDRFGLLQVSTGDLFRYEIGNNTPLGQEAKSYMDAGQLVPDDVTVRMLQNKLDMHPNVRGYILDGFPRTIHQSEALDELLASRGESVNALISLVVADDEIVTRLLERGKTSGRPDDANEEVIRKRIAVYKSNTAPVYQYYADQEKAVEIPGVGTIDEISAHLSQLVSQHLS
ncbi:MAG: adenylate kinase [Bacteroidota bacterium]